MMDNSTPIDDAWDWPFLFYVGTVLLHMTPAAFWKSTPRKLSILSKVHAEVNGSVNDKDKKNSGFIDQIF